MERGLCSRQGQEKPKVTSEGSPKVTSEQSPEGSKGVSREGIWGKVFGEKEHQIQICKGQHTGGQCSWNRVSGEENGHTSGLRWLR